MTDRGPNLSIDPYDPRPPASPGESNAPQSRSPRPTAVRGGGRRPLREARPDRLRDDQPAGGAERRQPRGAPGDDRGLGRLRRGRRRRRRDPHRRRRRLLRRGRPEGVHPADHRRRRRHRHPRDRRARPERLHPRACTGSTSRSSARSTAGRWRAASRRPWPATSGSPRTARCSAPSRPAGASTTAMAASCGWSTPAAPGSPLEMLLTAEPIDAQRALQCNLVSKVVPHERLMEEAETVARQILRNSQRAVRSAKQTILDTVGKTLDEQLRNEAWNAYSCADPRRHWSCSAASTRRRTPAAPGPTQRISERPLLAAGVARGTTEDVPAHTAEHPVLALAAEGRDRVGERRPGRVAVKCRNRGGRSPACGGHAPRGGAPTHRSGHPAPRCAACGIARPPQRERHRPVRRATH